ncbi:peptidyl-prolyl cis-trans isomerase [Pseudohongiella nitratireducens]|uniref:Peptidyl-prolyl cis-trans isomerase n=1 Tax=Pseudohongiella nitratireducens TaxID=1768907 RepID=A0A917GRL3_9GAMM|nr:peptidylprolyl isomerase [Pseudohongiella nitratireducens]MDF1622394.1 peptidylprolyl isomerase [Pseudohongiella nitratireducens]GGG54886.1 peptidyl-prolyl cis-trans isomerase [Pseudohongiella nitratireducens]|tara:strand:+ start:19690 stop:20187 length:498 start_codon:yes stop_codon:yes gene_type:complete
MPEQTQLAEISAGARVTLNFELALTDGEVIDSNYGRDPVTFVIGDGNMLPGFEAALEGLSQGDSVEITLAPEMAFGAVNPENVQSMPRQRFSGLLANTTDPVQEGTVLSFTDANGNDMPGIVRQIGELNIVIDFNHPLAGHDIVFKADIHAVIPPGTQTVNIQSV